MASSGATSEVTDCHQENEQEDEQEKSPPGANLSITMCYILNYKMNI